jgi:glycerophosphodiester phosphodiesterase
LTKDLVPVVYHDWVLSETGLKIPVNAVTLEEFQTLGPQKKKRHPVERSKNNRKQRASGSMSADEGSTTSSSGFRAERGMSLTALDDINHRHNHPHDDEVLEIGSFGGSRAKQHHHGGRGDTAIKAPFATLQELFAVHLLPSLFSQLRSKFLLELDLISKSSIQT